MKRLITLFALVALTGCVRDPELVEPVIPIPSARGVYIVNEGTWGRGNASLTYYDLGSFSVVQDAFGGANGRGLGDVGNQITIHDGLGYIVVNGSDRIEVIDLATQRSVASVSTGAGTSPRQIAFAGDSLCIVTALYDNSILIYRLSTMSFAGRVPVGNNPEGIAVVRGKAYVANSGFGSGNTVSVVDLTTRAVTGTITVGDNPSAVRLTEDGMVAVLCGGAYNDFMNPDDDTPALIALIDPATDGAAASITLGEHGMTFALSREGTAYVPLTTKVVAVDLRGRRVVGTFVERSFYGVGVEDVSGDVYLTDPKNYQSPGEVVVYAANGQLRTSFTAGVIPGSIAFKR